MGLLGPDWMRLLKQHKLQKRKFRGVWKCSFTILTWKTVSKRLMFFFFGWGNATQIQPDNQWPRKPELLKGLQDAGLSSASPIQQQSLLAIFAGKSLLAKAWFLAVAAEEMCVIKCYSSKRGEASNGNGRTEAFVIALLEKCHSTKNTIQGAVGQVPCNDPFLTLLDLSWYILVKRLLTPVKVVLAEQSKHNSKWWIMLGWNVGKWRKRTIGKLL